MQNTSTPRGRSGRADSTLIVSENISGHRLSYVRLLAEENVRRGRDTVVALPAGSLSSDVFSIHLGAIASELTVLEVDNFNITSLNRLARSVQASRTIVPDGDSLFYRVATSGVWTHGQLTLLIMRPGGQSSRPLIRRLGSAAKSVLRLASSKRRRLRVIVLVSAIAWDGSMRSAPDPVSVNCTAADVERTRVGWGEGPRYWFGVVGALDARKNIALVARSLRSLADMQIGLVLAGRGDVTEALDELRLLQNEGIPVIRREGLLFDKELDSIVSALDCVVLAHSNEGSSGIFGKALAAGTRIVAAGALSLRVDARLRPQSAVWVPLEEEPLIAALRRAVKTDPPTPEKLSSENFCRVMLQ